MTEIATGDRFTVAAVKEIRTPKGRMITKFLPDLDYRVTPRNLEYVKAMIEAGEATMGSALDAKRAANRLENRPARIRGRAKT